ncbi:hypothetical protein GCM10023194_75890 [Planotetraspora phitsanulokensis]|uniref:Uncharacterized protein n=1 Tax=Planotetraspora phitsanulokensis TaxID=575192 RepID=A0A8J3XGC2_9ACTN|nr:hypothetical protein Pph01_04060 [Planotetraspora phitsanulokensis]
MPRGNPKNDSGLGTDARWAFGSGLHFGPGEFALAGGMNGSVNAVSAMTATVVALPKGNLLYDAVLGRTDASWRGGGRRILRREPAVLGKNDTAVVPGRAEIDRIRR